MQSNFFSDLNINKVIDNKLTNGLDAARPETDWWILAVTIVEKLSPFGQGITHGGRNRKSRTELLKWFSNHNSQLFDLLSSKIQE